MNFIINFWNALPIIFRILGSLGLFLYGMRVMSDGLQKAAGNKLQNILNYMTSNRFAAVFTGFLVTSFIQSSSATTVMLVSFVNASLLNLTQAIGVIMGANIGTTITAWIISVIGFKFKITAIALPVVGFGLPFLFSKVKKRRDFGEILIGFGLLFLGLMFLKSSVPHIDTNNPAVLSFIQNYNDLTYPLSFFLFIAVGTILTIVIQSSSASMAITITMAFFGWINFENAAAMVLGENIGTTVTAYLASLGANVNARRTARAHFLFNIFGVIWMGFLFKLFTAENGIIYKLALLGWNPTKSINFPLNLSLFHTVFNLINTAVCIGFVKYFAKAVEKLVKPKKGDISKKEYKLKYISTGLQDTTQINILEAKREVTKMAEVTEKMFNIFLKVFSNPDKKMDSKIREVKDLEELTDQMQIEISKYLAECSKEELSDTEINNLNAMMRIVHELESVGDSIYRLILLAQRKYNKKIILHKTALSEIQNFSKLIVDCIKFYQEHLGEHLHKKDFKYAIESEKEIDKCRAKYKKGARKRLQKGANVQAELLYIDFLRYYEHIGDNSLNIAQALRQIT